MAHRTDKDRVRYAVVGAGNIAQVAVLPAFAHAKENTELAAIVSDNAEKRASLGKKYGVATATYADLETIADQEEVDAVYLALPNTLHRPFVERAAAAGLHVLCEKPMAMTPDDCEAMVSACDEADVRLMIAYRLHFEECNLRAVEIVRSGQIGEPRFFSAAFSQQVRSGDIRTQSQTGGGALFDLGIYCINAARFLFAAEPIEVVAFQVHGSDERFREVDEMTSGLVRFPGNCIAQITASQGASDVDSYRIVGTDGDLRVEPGFGYTGVLKHFLTVGGKTEETTFGKRDQFAPELVHFSQCILEGTRPRPSGREGWADVRVMDAMAQSARTGERVALDRFDPGARPDPSQEIRKPAVRPPKTVHAPSPSR
ncbi:MAG TPA: Gfo/Idh/MocA family oxidoreductase [Polyangiaceae bacterium]|jgi:predicted dehydrogenase|nr:Gfo/Idh/MocA family oxidoreductase [Polyangiaceae bacterium]